MWLSLWLFGIAVGISMPQLQQPQQYKSEVFYLMAFNNSWMDPPHSELFDFVSGVFCKSHLKVVHVYYEMDFTLRYSGQILRNLNHCGISYVALRNDQQSSHLKIISDDGILLYLVMILRDISHPVDLSVIRKKSAAKHLTYIMILIQEPHTVTETWLRTTFGKFWKWWILNVVVVFPEPNHRHIELYRYDPFAKTLIHRIAHGPKNFNLADLYPKDMLNMRGNPLQICLYQDNIRTIFENNGKILGTDGLMSSYFVERLNATPMVGRIGTYGNTSISEDLCFKETFNEMSDIATNIRFLSMDTFYGRVEFTTVLSRDDLCVLIPKAKIASSFWNLFRSFSISVWILICVSLVMAYLFCSLIYRNIFAGDKLLLDLLSCVISTPRAKLQKSRMSARLFFYVWLVYGLLISAAFKGNLTSNLVDREYLPDVNTLQELAESKYPLATLPRHIKHLNRYLDLHKPAEALLRRKIVPLPDAYFNGLIEQNNISFAYLQKYHISVFRANSRKHSRNGKPCYHAMAQCIVPFHAVYIVPYGSPYLGYINQLIRNAQEFGYYLYWDSMMSAVFRRSRRNGQLQRRDDSEPEVLQLFHFHSAYCFWAMGLLMAGICFAWEILNVKISF
ncbi:ionotropic receptor 85a [Musca autumnalis]|uniref:ionotropic receptor 85a n=1 Tax=Musca autumnalis TaxID=221902 RepID=UPI003CF0A04F